MKYIIIFSILIGLISCTATRLGEQQSLGLDITNTITADIETTPTPQGREDDSADDPAVWIHPTDVEKSLIFGTDKKAGIGTYNLQGKEVSYDVVGRINNIDIRQNILLNGQNYDVIAGSNRSNNNLIIGHINQNGKVDYKHISGAENLKNKEVYGFALGYYNHKLKAFVNAKDGHIFIYDLSFENDTWLASLTKTLKLKTQPEGMVVDDELGFLYIGEEENTVWKIDLNDYTFKRLNQASEKSNPNLKYDIEGLSIYKTEAQTGYLILSSQGNNSYAIYTREGDNQYIKSFRIVDGVVDGVEETDGLDFSNHAFNAQFPKGIMVVQDGFNFDGKKKKSQNFKIINWQKIEQLIQE